MREERKVGERVVYSPPTDAETAQTCDRPDVHSTSAERQGASRRHCCVTPRASALSLTHRGLAPFLSGLVLESGQHFSQLRDGALDVGLAVPR
jgi:hypothetical protein